MANPLALIFDLIAKDSASPAFLRVAGAADKAAAATERSTSKLAGANAAMTKFGATLTKSVTLPLLGLAAVSLDQAAKFQKSVTLIQTAGGETAAKTAVISKGIQQVAESTGTSLKDLSDGIYTVAKAGAQKWSATDQLLVLKAAAQGAKAENVDLGTAVNALTSVMQSYGAKASDAVAIENQLIKASGLSKTTFQDFSTSLSNVIPLASSLGISFAQVGGALATMTQHGESAQQSTDNLNNLIRNLAGQNNVASQAMQQLGINTVSLRKNLSTNGLTGTLAIVEDALAKSSKGGLVVVSAFKQAALATQSLNTMIGTMNGDLKTQSEGLLKGSTSIKDYRTMARDLGGTAGASALQFLALYQSSLGFSNALKSGNSTVSTAATQLQKMLGGATGLNVALMLGGTSTKAFTANVDLIAQAAKGAGVDVLGWSKTQGTLSVQLDKAKENLQVLAVEIGTALIPVVTKMVGWVQSSVQWFENLSDGTKKWLGRLAIAGAVIGPVLLIGGKLLSLFGLIARANTLLWAGGAKVAGAFKGTGAAAATSAAEIETAEATQTSTLEAAVTAQVAALERLALAYSTTANSSVLNLGRMRAANAAALGSAGVGGAATAEEGAVAGGGLSRLRAGGTGSLVAGAGLLVGGQLLGHAISGNSKQGSGRNIAGTAAADAGIGAAVGSLAGPEGIAIGAALGASYGALSSWIKGMGLLSAGEKDYDSITKNAKETVTSFAAALEKGGAGLAANQKSAAQAALAHTDLAARAAKAGLTQTDLTNAITGNDAAFTKLVDAWRASGKPSEDTIGALQELHDQFGAAAGAAQRFADSQGQLLPLETKVGTVSDLLTGKLGEVGKANVTAAQYATDFKTGLDNLSTSVKNNGATLDGNTSFGMKNIAVLRQAAAEALAHAQAVYNQTGSLKQANAALESDRAALLKTATQAGLSAAAATKVANSILGIPKAHSTTITVSTPGVTRALEDLSSLQSLLNSIENSGPVAPKVQTPGLLSGGLVGVTPPKTTKPPYAAGGSVADGWFTVGEQGYELGRKQGSHVQIFSNAQSQQMTGMSRVPGYAAGTGSSLSTFAKAIASFTTAIFKSTATTDDLKSAVSSLTDAAKTAGVSSSRLAAASKLEGALVADASKRDALNARLGTAPNNTVTAYDKLTTAIDNFNNDKSSIAAAIKQGFNIQTAGQDPRAAAGLSALPGGDAGPVADTLANLQDQINQASKFAANLSSLSGKLGTSAASKEILAGLAAGGPSASGAETAALSGASKAQIAALVAGQAKLDAIANSTAQKAATALDGAQVAATQKVVTQLVKLEAALTVHIDTIGKQVAAALNGTARTSANYASTKTAGR